MPKPSRRRSEARQRKQRKPEIIAVLVEKRALVTVEKCRRSAVHRQLGILVGIRLLNSCRADFPCKRLTNGEKLPGKRGHRRLGQCLSSDDQVLDAERLHLILRSGGGRVEDAERNLLGGIARILEGDC